MAVNPIYEQTTDGIYEVIMHHNNITSLGTVSDGFACKNKEPYNNGKLCDIESHFPPPLSTKIVNEDDVERDEYVQMSALTSKYANKPCSTSPRYIETPGTIPQREMPIDTDSP